MPRYDYICKSCNSDFFIISGINENRDNIECTECNSENVRRIFNSIIIKKRTKDYLEESESKPEVKVDKHLHKDPEEHGHCSPDIDYL